MELVKVRKAKLMYLRIINIDFLLTDTYLDSVLISRSEIFLIAYYSLHFSVALLGFFSFLSPLLGKNCLTLWVIFFTHPSGHFLKTFFGNFDLTLLWSDSHLDCICIQVCEVVPDYLRTRKFV